LSAGRHNLSQLEEQKEVTANKCVPSSCFISPVYWANVFIVYLFAHISFPQSGGYSVSEQDKIKFSMCIMHFLLPWLKQFHQEQMQEKSAEAATKGSMIAMPTFGFLVHVHGCYS
jgi:hypothetical protein